MNNRQFLKAAIQAGIDVSTLLVKSSEGKTKKTLKARIEERRKKESNRKKVRRAQRKAQNK